MSEGARSVPKHALSLQVVISTLLIALVVSNCSRPSTSSADEQEAIVTKYEKEVKAAIGLCQTSMDVAGDNFKSFENGKLEAVEAYRLMTNGWTTCGEQVDLVSQLPVPTNVNENVERAFQRMGDTCTSGMTKQRDAIDAMRNIVNGDKSPAAIDAVTRNPMEAKPLLEKCDYEFERAQNAAVGSLATPG